MRKMKVGGKRMATVRGWWDTTRLLSPIGVDALADM
jgi:hypothetical protein